MPTPSRTRILPRLVPVFLVFTALALPPTGLAQQLAVDPHHAFPQDQVFTVDLVIGCGGLEVKGLEAALVFDAALLQLDDVTPGPWFTGSGHQYFFFDYTDQEPQGNIHLATSILDGAFCQDDVFAVFHFTSLGSGATAVDFVDLDVRDTDNMAMPFVHTTGDSISIDPAVPAVVRSFGFLKAVYR